MKLVIIKIFFLLSICSLFSQPKKYSDFNGRFNYLLPMLFSDNSGQLANSYNPMYIFENNERVSLGFRAISFAGNRFIDSSFSFDVNKNLASTIRNYHLHMIRYLIYDNGVFSTNGYDTDTFDIFVDVYSPIFFNPIPKDSLKYFGVDSYLTPKFNDDSRLSKNIDKYCENDIFKIFGSYSPNIEVEPTFGYESLDADKNYQMVRYKVTLKQLFDKKNGIQSTVKRLTPFTKDLINFLQIDYDTLKSQYKIQEVYFEKHCGKAKKQSGVIEIPDIHLDESEIKRNLTFTDTNIVLLRNCDTCKEMSLTINFLPDSRFYFQIFNYRGEKIKEIEIFPKDFKTTKYFTIPKINQRYHYMIINDKKEVLSSYFFDS